MQQILSFSTGCLRDLASSSSPVTSSIEAGIMYCSFYRADLSILRSQNESFDAVFQVPTPSNKILKHTRGHVLGEITTLYKTLIVVRENKSMNLIITTFESVRKPASTYWLYQTSLIRKSVILYTEETNYSSLSAFLPTIALKTWYFPSSSLIFRLISPLNLPIPTSSYPKSSHIRNIICQYNPPPIINHVLYILCTLVFL